MYQDRVEKALDVAAAPTLRDMERQRQGLPRPLFEVITHLIDHLFDPELTVQRTLKAVGIKDQSLLASFRDATDLTLRQYIERRRLEVADRMVRMAPEVELQRISLAIGYLYHQTFLAAYKRGFGETPSQARAKAGPPELDYLEWRRFLRGELDLDAAWQFYEDALQRYPSLEPRLRERYGSPTVEPRVEIDGERFERWSAEGLWQELKALPFEEQRRRLRTFRFRSSVLFDLLREKSRQEGRKNRQRGVEVARLALLSLEGSEDVFGERIHELRALGWAWLGNAHVLALELLAADAAFDEAFNSWSHYRYEPDSLILGDLWRFKSTLYMYQRDYGEALGCVERSAEVFRRATDAVGQVKALSLRAAIRGYTEQWADSVKDFQRADSLLDGQSDPFLRFASSINVANSLVRIGHAEEASKSLSKARELHLQLDYPLGSDEMTYLEGCIEECNGNFATAQTLYYRALTGFERAKARFHAALCLLDLMSLCANQDEWGSVLEVGPQAIANIQSLNLHEETIAAVKLLAEALQIGEVSDRLLREVRNHLRIDPLASLSRGD